MGKNDFLGDLMRTDGLRRDDEDDSSRVENGAVDLQQVGKARIAVAFVIPRPVSGSFQSLGQFQRNLSVLFNMGDENLAHDRNRRGSAEYNPAGPEDSSSDLNRPTWQATAIERAFSRDRCSWDAFRCCRIPWVLPSVCRQAQADRGLSTTD